MDPPHHDSLLGFFYIVIMEISLVRLYGYENPLQVPSYIRSHIHARPKQSQHTTTTKPWRPQNGAKDGQRSPSFTTSTRTR